MFDIIIALFVFLFFTFFSNGVSGGAVWQPPVVEPIYLDAKIFVQFSLWYIGKGVNPTSWASVRCRTNSQWCKLLDKNYQNGLMLANEHTKMVWLDFSELPQLVTTKYLRDYRVTLDTLKGQDSFLMTPYLREYQRKNFLQYIPRGASIFDIGIGTGRSKELWVESNASVWGVEYDEKNYNALINKRIPQIREVRHMGGESDEIQKWIDPGSMDVVMMVYSITFFYESMKKLDALVSNIRHMLKPGGRFILIGMDGDRVSEWPTKVDNSCFKLSRKRNEIQITMKSPFSLVKDQTEYLVDFGKLETKLGMKKIHDEHVAAPYYLGEWPAKFVAAQRFMVFQI